MPLSGGEKNDVRFQSDLLQTCLQLAQHKITVEFKFQLDRTAGFAVKCRWVPKNFRIWRFCYAEIGFDFSSSSFNSSTKGHLEFRIIFIPWANCSSGERLSPSWATCYGELEIMKTFFTVGPFFRVDRLRGNLKYFIFGPVQFQWLSNSTTKLID